MKRQVLYFGFFLLAIMLLAPSAANANHDSAVRNVTVTVTVPEIFGIEVVNGDLNWIGNYAPTMANFDATVPEPWESEHYGWTSKKTLRSGSLPTRVGSSGSKARPTHFSKQPLLVDGLRNP